MDDTAVALAKVGVPDYLIRWAVCILAVRRAR